ncbi:MAG TPA: XdhC/CoxI family protein [Thermomicrobiaceae bacterium]|nr:XdhC/CoxI family protein [Thermomicrobiaceae bacterium]
MRDIINEITEWQSEGEEIALATVVRASGSAPRPVGAKLALTKSGRMAGSVSGGCVEGAVFEAGQEVLASGQTQLKHYGISDEMAFDVGLSCGGVIDVFVEPFAHQPVVEAILADQSLAVATVIAGEFAGNQLVVDEQGARQGTLGSPALDEQVAADVPALLEAGKSETRGYTAAGDEVDVYIESHTPRRHLVVVGAVHIAIPLVAYARELGYRTTVIDPRGLFATGERFPDVDELIEEWPDEAMAKLTIGPMTDIVVLAHDSKFEDPALHAALDSRAGYIGAMGSKKTSAERLERLRAEGLSEESIGRIHGPIGLNIGARTPAEIAISILAEIIAVRHGKVPGSALKPAKSEQPVG